MPSHYDKMPSISNQRAHTGVEDVFVKKAMDDKAIIVRKNGEIYLIEEGVGCLSLWRYEGRHVYIKSPGLFLGVGSELLLPDDNQQCRIWNSESLGDSSAQSKIDADFEGFDEGNIYILANGQIWRQTEYKYKYRYSYRPNVTIFKDGSRYRMLVDGMNDFVRVERIK